MFPIDLDEAGDHVVGDVVRHLPAVLPDEIAGRGVEGLDDIARVRHVHDAVVDERRALLAAGAEGARPDEAQIAHVVAIDLVERAVAPAVERAAPHQPVAGGAGSWSISSVTGTNSSGDCAWAAPGTRARASVALASAVSSARRAVRHGRCISGLRISTRLGQRSADERSRDSIPLVYPAWAGFTLRCRKRRGRARRFGALALVPAGHVGNGLHPDTEPIASRIAFGRTICNSGIIWFAAATGSRPSSVCGARSQCSGFPESVGSARPSCAGRCPRSSTSTASCRARAARWRTPNGFSGASSAGGSWSTRSSACATRRSC